MKKVLLHKFGTSPPRDENPLLKLRRPVFKSKSRTFKSLSISSRDIAGVGALLALSPACAVAAAYRKKGKAGRGGGGTHSNSTTSSDESGQHSRPHSPLVNLSSSPIVSTINKKPKRTVKKKRSSSFTKPRSRNSVKLLVDEATGKRNKHRSACHARSSSPEYLCATTATMETTMESARRMNRSEESCPRCSKSFGPDMTSRLSN